ncbi:MULTISPECIES: universal stress protein [unclassified Kitasatospora]|uniref:universal stress protein n=1 Tax=unclassified Kitasatospora TaxID=2633591 RepID=UPI0033E0D68D
MDQDVGAQHRVVVGVDGSPSSKRALRWALGQAASTGAVVEAVACWRPASMYEWAVHGQDSGHAEAAQKSLAAAVAEVIGAAPAVEVRQSTVTGNPAEVLVERSRGADLLVVGHRGHGGFAGLRLGSVSHACAQHAACPVVIVRDDS